MNDIPPVHQALAAVMAELPAIGKTDKQSHEGYMFRGIEAVTRHVQPLLAKHGVVIVPDARITEVKPAPAMKDGWQDVIMHVDWTIYGPDGSCVKAATTGIGRDKSDKGANKAQTQAFKYLLLHLLCIADSKDDADAHTYEHDRADGATEAAADASAQQRGFASFAEQRKAFDALRDRTKAIADAEKCEVVKAWVKAEHITSGLSRGQADEWERRISAAGSDDREASGAAQGFANSAAEPDPAPGAASAAVSEEPKAEEEAPPQASSSAPSTATEEAQP